MRMADADRMDLMYLHAQLVSGTKTEDLVATTHRDALDDELLTPIGEEQSQLADLITYLRS